jgi:hypothetical protein
MIPAEFYILGPRVGEELTYWNLDKGWVTEFAEGTPFTGEILTLPLPEGATNVMAFSSASEPLAQSDPLPGGGAVNFFHKSY